MFEFDTRNIRKTTTTTRQFVYCVDIQVFSVIDIPKLSPS